MAVAADIQAFLQQLITDNIPDLSLQTVAEARARSDYFLKIAAKPDTTGIHIENIDIPSDATKIAIRIYRPQQTMHQASVIWLHGGGFVLGSLDQAEAICIQLVKTLNVQVFSIDYRLAPEHRFPAATHDCFAATDWLHQNAESMFINHEHLFIAGTSAGANLATVVTLMRRDQKKAPLTGQILFYPVTDNNPHRESYKKYGDNLYLTMSGMRWFWEKYVDEANTARHSPYAFPFKAQSLNHLSPAFIITAEYDLLIDEGFAYAERLRQYDVPVEYRCAPGMIHAFTEFAAVIPSANKMFNQYLMEIKDWMAATTK